MNTLTPDIIQFDLPERLACPKPTEERNLPRDYVRLLVTTGSGKIERTLFRRLDDYLQPGDVLAVNSSATVASALPVHLPDWRKGMAHLSGKLSDHEWLIEIRELRDNKTLRWKAGEEGMILRGPGLAKIILTRRYYQNRRWLDLWVAEIMAGQPLEEYLARYASPIKYENLDKRYPLSYYQTFFSFHPGSAEMPSAGRGFTKSLVEKLAAKGVVFAPFLLHTGVSSLEENEKPYPEYMEISPLTAATVNAAKAQGRRVIAVGTTAVRALESAVNGDGSLTPFRGNTELYIDSGYKMKIADGLLTGFHEPRASHLHMLQAVAGVDHIENAYKAAIEESYYWHQFGDLHLILP